MRKGNKFFLKSPRPSLPLKRAPPLTPTLSPQERGRKPLLLVARNRYALRLADQSGLARLYGMGPHGDDWL